MMNISYEYEYIFSDGNIRRIGWFTAREIVDAPKDVTGRVAPLIESTEPPVGSLVGMHGGSAPDGVKVMLLRCKPLAKAIAIG